MINYLKSEVYRLSLMKSTYFIPVSLLAFLFFMLGITYITALDNPEFPYNNANFIFMFVQSSITVVSALIPFIVNKIFADEYGNGTFKNSIAYGVNRKILYFGKLILMMTYAIFVSAIVLILFVIGTNILMESGTTADMESQRIFIKAVFKSIPIFLAMLSFSHMLSFVVKKTSSHWGIYVVVIFAFPTVLNRLLYAIDNGFLKLLLNLTPSGLLTNISTGSLIGEPSNYRYMPIVFLLYTVISIIVGLQSFKKQDV